jgi:hypothetical protein
VKRQEISNLDDLDRLEGRILCSVKTAAATLKNLLESVDSVGVFAKLKFTEVGIDPIDVSRPLNLVEQLNQTFTYLASVAGARWIASRYPESLPLLLNLGTSPGFDIQSGCGKFIAETFAVTHPNSNDKLRKDVSRLEENTSAEHRFVFYLSPVEARQLGTTNVTIVRIDHPAMASL